MPSSRRSWPSGARLRRLSICLGCRGNSANWAMTLSPTRWWLCSMRRRPGLAPPIRSPAVSTMRRSRPVLSQQRTLDWAPNFDPQSIPHRLALLDCYKIGLSKKQIQRTKKIFLDQGQEGACTGFGEEHVRALSPRGRSDVNNESARRVYDEARRQDEWPGEDYEGSSVNVAMKAAR